MSIIYDALKKLDKTRSQGTNLAENMEASKKTTRHKPKKILLYILVIVIGIVFGNIIFGVFARPKDNNAAIKNKPQLPPAPSAVTITKVIPRQEAAEAIPQAEQVAAQAQATSPSSYSLNGVFYSENESYALINNQVVRVGDEIDGAVVKKIGLDEVELETPTSTITLNSRTK